MADSETEAKRGSAHDDILAEGRKAFEKCSDAERDNRKTALDDIRFAREGIQWPDDVRAQREREGRPCLTINKLPAFIRQVVNDARQNKPSIKVRPADSGADVKTADIMSGLIRNIEYTSNADVAYDTAVECAVTGGVGYIRVGLDYAYDDTFDMDITIDRVANPFSVYGDPNSRAADSSDWDVAFVTDRLTKEQYAREYGDKDKVDWDDDAWSGVNNTDWLNDDGVLVAEWWTREKEDEEIFLFADKRSGKPFVATQKQLEDPDILMLVEMGLLEYRQQRTRKTCKVTQRIMSGADVLKETDWLGQYIPIVPVYGDEFDIEGKRYFRSLIHNAVDAQKMFNYWRTASTELVALAPKVPFIGPKGAFSVDEGWGTANTRSHPYLEYDPAAVAKAGAAPPQRQPLDMGVAAGALQEALNASDDIKSIVGMFDASLGAKSNETSGKAILARQREGDISTFHFIDNMARAIRHTGRILIDLIPKVYDTPRIVRVIGEDGSQSEQTVNQEAPAKDDKGNPMERPKIDPNTRQPVRGPDGNPVMEAVMAMHDLTAGKYDLTVTTGPSFTTRREEAAAQMTEMLRAFPPAAPIIGPELAKNLDWPGADKIAEKLEALTSGQVPDQVKKAIEEGKQKIQQLSEENQKLKLDQSANMAKQQSDFETKRMEIAAKERMQEMEIQSKERLALVEIESEERIANYRSQIQAQAQAARPVVQSSPRQTAA